MRQLIKKLDSSLLEIYPIVEYLSQFEEYTVENENIEKDSGEIIISSENELLNIIFMKIADRKLWNIYRYHQDGIKYQQIDVIIYDKIQKKEYNRVIKFSEHIEDDDYSYITCSCFSLLNDEIIKSWRKHRVVSIQDLPKIQYSKNMSLTELLCMSDDKNIHFIKKEEQKDVKRLILK